MATEVFSWGFTGWLTHRCAHYEVYGFIDGCRFFTTGDTPGACEATFARAARRAWLRRKLRALRGLPPRQSSPIDAADTYHEIRIGAIFLAIAVTLFRR